MKNVIGENIKRVREKKGMTQKELAEKCNLLLGNMKVEKESLKLEL